MCPGALATYGVAMPQMVMVVEDDANIGTLVRTYLQRDRYEALWVRSGEDALAELPRHPIALVVLDIGLPGIDGFEVLRRIGGRVPVVMLTARDEVADRVAGLELGPTTICPSRSPRASSPPASRRSCAPARARTTTTSARSVPLRSRAAHARCGSTGGRSSSPSASSTCSNT